MDCGRTNGTLSLHLEVFRLPIRLWILRCHCFQRLAHDGGDCSIARPFAIRGNDVPRRPFRRASAEHQLVGLLVFIPPLAIFKVTWVELPATLRLVEPCLQTLSLFLLG